MYVSLSIHVDYTYIYVSTHIWSDDRDDLSRYVYQICVLIYIYM